jgi:hypothetical protein
MVNFITLGRRTIFLLRLSAQTVGDAVDLLRIGRDGTAGEFQPPVCNYLCIYRARSMIPMIAVARARFIEMTNE